VHAQAGPPAADARSVKQRAECLGAVISRYRGKVQGRGSMRTLQEREAGSPWRSVPWAATIALLAACGEQHQPRSAPIARRLGGDSMVPGALIQICKPEDEACVPTYAVKCSMTWRGDPAQKPNLPQLSPEERAWCEQETAAAVR
jgi:hypothetical protein